MFIYSLILPDLSIIIIYDNYLKIMKVKSHDVFDKKLKSVVIVFKF